MSHYLFPQKKPPNCTTKLIAANQNDTLERCYFIFKTSQLFCWKIVLKYMSFVFFLFTLMYSRACVVHMVKNKVLLIGGAPKSRNFREFDYFFPCFVIRKFFNAMKVKNLTILTFLTCLKLFHFFPRESFFLRQFLPLKYTHSLWRRLLNYNYYNSLLGTTWLKIVASKRKKVYRNWWSKPISVSVWIPCFRHEKKRRKMRRKGMICSQNRYFHRAFGGFAPWNPHQGSVLDPLEPPAAKGPQTILCLTFQFSKVGTYGFARRS